MSTTTVSDSATSQRGAFIRARLASLLAVLPLGVWTVIHVWNNLAAFRGAEAWQSAVTEHAHPGAVLTTSIIVLAPLLIHTVWGIKRLITSRPNNQRYGFYFNLKYLLQRLSAIGVLLFICAHLWLAFIQPRVVHGRPEPFADIAREMAHHGPTLIVYLLGTLGVAFHLANGLYNVAMGWGIATSRGAMKRFERFVIGFFIVLLGMSWGAIYALWQAGA